MTVPGSFDCSRRRALARLAAGASTLSTLSAARLARGGDRGALRVSADPNNLPFTNELRVGFENRIADLLAAELGVELRYAWRAQRRGFFRVTLKEDEADLILGVPVGFERALTTAAYYRSSYVFATRKGATPPVRSFDDPALRRLKIGVQLVGDDGVNTPPAHALAARGLVENVSGFTVYGDYAEQSPPARIVEALGRGEVDVAVVWGPMAGYHARRLKLDLELTPVRPEVDPSGLPFAFDIGMGVRRGDADLKRRVDGFLARRSAEVGRILDEFGVPRVAPVAAKPEAGRSGGAGP